MDKQTELVRKLLDQLQGQLIDKEGDVPEEYKALLAEFEKVSELFPMITAIFLDALMTIQEQDAKLEFLKEKAREHQECFSSLQNLITNYFGPQGGPDDPDDDPGSPSIH